MEIEPKKKLTGKTVGYIALLIICIIYIINPGSGIIEIIPDFVPIAGNLDEAAATAIGLEIIRRLREGQAG